MVDKTPGQGGEAGAQFTTPATERGTLRALASRGGDIFRGAITLVTKPVKIANGGGFPESSATGRMVRDSLASSTGDIRLSKRPPLRP